MGDIPPPVTLEALMATLTQQNRLLTNLSTQTAALNNNTKKMDMMQADFGTSKTRLDQMDPPEPEPPDSYNKGYPKPWIDINDKFYSHGSIATLTKVMSFSLNEDYMDWEDNMEDYFWDYDIPDEEKVSHAIATLTGEAHQWWLHEECTYYKGRPLHWDRLKWSMYEHFVRKKISPRTSQTPRTNPKKACCSEPKKVSQGTLKRKTEAKHPAKVKDVQGDLNQQTVAQKENSKSLLEPHDKPEQCKSSQTPKVAIKICYRCHKRGHFAATCPERQVNNSASLEQKLNLPNSSECLAQSDFKISNSDMMCLSLPKVIDAGINQSMEHKVKKVDPETTTPEPESNSLHGPSPNDVLVTFQEEQEVKLSSMLEQQPPEVLTCQYTHEKDTVATSSVLRQEEPPDHMLNLYTIASSETELIRSSDQSVENSPGMEEKQLEHESQRNNGDNNCEKGVLTKTPTLLPKDVDNEPWRGVISSMLIKEEPPDAYKPNHNQGNQVLRTKLLEEGGYDEDIKSSSSTEKETMRHVEENMGLRRAKGLNKWVCDHLYSFSYSLVLSQWVFQREVLTRQIGSHTPSPSDHGECFGRVKQRMVWIQIEVIQDKLSNGPVRAYGPEYVFFGPSPSGYDTSMTCSIYWSLLWNQLAQDLKNWLPDPPQAFKTMQRLVFAPFKESRVYNLSSTEATPWRPSRSMRGFPFNPGRRPYSSQPAGDTKQQVESPLALFRQIFIQCSNNPYSH